MKRVCVNCGSNPGSDPCYLKMATSLGTILATRKIDLVYGGADVGLMGQVANSVLEAGGKVIGVIPKSFAHKVSHQGLTELFIVDSMHERKTKMFELSDAFIGLPGGYGTLEEIFELLTWAQLGISNKPCGLLNVDGYYDLLLSFLDNAVEKGFIKKQHRNMLLVSDNPTLLLQELECFTVPVVEKWIKQE